MNHSNAAGYSRPTTGATLHFGGTFVQSAGGQTILNGGTITSAAPLDIQGGLLIFRYGTYNFQPSAYVNPAGMDVQVDGTGALNFTASQTLKSLIVKIGTRANVTPGGDKVLRLNTLDLNLQNVQNGTSTAGRLDLADNDLIIDYTGATSPIGTLAANFRYTGIQRLLQLGRNDGTWDGVGLITDRPDADAGLTTLGVAEARNVIDFGGATTTTWNGQTVDQTAVLVKYTYAGDFNLDGFISGDDYAAIDFNVAVPGASGYYNGDVNFDGIISGDDYAAIDFNIVAQGAPL